MEPQKVNQILPFNSWRFVILMTLALGMAPYFPEPHIWGKVRWIAGGAVGMKLVDWGDFLMHGLPWILLIRLGIIQGRKRFRVSAKN